MREDDLFKSGSIDEMADLLACLFIQIGRLIAEPMDAAMDVGVAAGVDIDQSVDHLPRPLSGGRVVEINERLAVRPNVGQDGKICTDARGVERRCCEVCHASNST